VKPGTIVGGCYELVEKAGEGGMATVWRAVRRGAAGFSLTVAVKMVKPEYKKVGDHVAMFVEEARVGSELQHANIVQVHDFGLENDSYFLVMEWVDGMSLLGFNYAHFSREQWTPWETVAAIAIEALRGLSAAHLRHKSGQPAPVIHRDVSPENILLGVNGQVKLSDFGFARAKDRVARLTDPGVIKGKISYIAPEMTRGEPAGVRSDVFAMGVVLWESLAGSKLFKGEFVEVFRQIVEARIRPLRHERPDLPESLLAVVERALSPDPAGRYGSAAEMAEALASILRTVPRITDTNIGAAVADARAALRGRAAPASAPSLSIPIIVVHE
jgi:serine/threonine protein kinase